MMTARLCEKFEENTLHPEVGEHEEGKVVEMERPCPLGSLRSVLEVSGFWGPWGLCGPWSPGFMESLTSLEMIPIGVPEVPVIPVVPGVPCIARKRPWVLGVPEFPGVPWVSCPCLESLGPLVSLRGLWRPWHPWGPCESLGYHR